MIELLLIVLIIGGAAWLLSSRNSSKQQKQVDTAHLEDARAEARHWVDRLGSQVLSLSGTDTASTQAMADASERYNAASSQLSTANSVKQANLAREAALEGLYYVSAAREIMGMPPGPELPALEGQKNAGAVTERRTIEHEGQTLTASPVATEETPNYYPGGNVAGRPVPAGWYSAAWWAPALASGIWSMSSMMMFSAMFAGMSGVNYNADAWADGYGAGLEDAASNLGGEDLGGEDLAGDMGGEDFGGDFDGGGFFDGGGLDFGFDLGFD